MKIDILDKTHFRLYEENIKKAFATIYHQIQELNKMILQLQDRIKMLEDKDGT